MSNTLYSLLLQGTLETLYMVGISSLLATLLGLPLGTLLFITQKQTLCYHIRLYQVLTTLVNMLRAIPFIILLVILIPLTRLLIGTTIGTNAAIVPLSVCAAPFVARIVEGALKNVSAGLIEAGHAMGTTQWQLIYKILIPEAMPAIVRGVTLTVNNLVSYSAMAGAIGGGGLGSIAIDYGYQRFNVTVLLATVVILIFLVQGIQWLGGRIEAMCMPH